MIFVHEEKKEICYLYIILMHTLINLSTIFVIGGLFFF
jgi:hypothetical protein